MNSFINYIETNYSNELKLLIYLSQDELTHPGAINLDKVDWKVFVQLAIKHRLTSHILKHAKFLAENIPIPTYEKLIDIRLERSKKSLSFAIHAIRIHQKLKENNIPHLFFKGPLLSLQLYNDIGYRNFRDIDLLVDISNVEAVKSIIEDLDFNCIYPRLNLSKKQKKVNYTISHHYHFTHPSQHIDIELHWNITNPKSYYNKPPRNILEEAKTLKVSNYELPYISNLDNIVYQAAHGGIHQWYRLFWIKDFSVLISQSDIQELREAYELSKQLKLQKAFIQACVLCKLIYKVDVTDSFKFDLNEKIIRAALKSICTKDLSQRGIKGKILFVFYRLNLKKDFRYYTELLYRLRTHLTDWEIINIKDHFFFLYYFLRPFLLIYKYLFRKSS